MKKLLALILTATAIAKAATNSVTLTWDPNPVSDGVTAYKLWSATNVNGPFTLLTTITNAAASNLVFSASGQRQWFYMTAAYSNWFWGTGETVSSVWVYVPPTPSNPTNLAIGRVTSTNLAPPAPQ